MRHRRRPPAEEVTYGFGLLEPGGPDAYATTGFNQGEFVSNINFSHRATADPLVAPGNPNFWHAHDFFVNPSTDAFSTIESLMADRWHKRLAGQQRIGLLGSEHDERDDR